MNNLDKEEKVDSQLLIEQLKAENELKTKWLSLIAHDFRGLFSNISMLLSALESESISQEIFLSMLPELKQIADKNTKTLESTFAWVNSQTEGFNPHVEDVVIHNLFLELKDKFREELEVKEISLVFVGDEEISLPTDRFLLIFVLKQIIENAIKYSHKKGVIEVIVHSDSKSNKMNITIKDNGVGMKSGIANNIGTLDGSPHTGTLQEKGAGLSLVIVKDFVGKLNGQISITSIMNEGTSIMLSFRQKLND